MKQKQSKPFVAALRHTGRPLPRHHTSYALLWFITLCVGVVLTGVTVTANAALLTYKGSVPGEAPTDPAVITSPADNTRFTSKPIQVKGTCPDNTIVRLYRNDTFSGESYCYSSGDFTIQTDLFVGANTLQAKVFNFGETEGPASDTITVTYDPPASPPATADGGSTSSGQPTPSKIPALVLTGDTQHRAYNVGEKASWLLTIEGGRSPYNIKTDWGDGKISTAKQLVDGDFTIEHVFTKPSTTNGAFVITVTVSDSSGQQSLLQLTTVVLNPKTVALTTGTDGLDGLASLQMLQLVRKQLLLGWPLYIMVSLMLISFWLGERQATVGKKTRSKRNYHRPAHA